MAEQFRKTTSRIHHGQLRLGVNISVAMKSPLGGQIEMLVPGTIASSCAKPHPSR